MLMKMKIYAAQGSRCGPVSSAVLRSLKTSRFHAIAPRPAEALVGANLPEMCRAREAA